VGTSTAHRWAGTGPEGNLPVVLAHGTRRPGIWGYRRALSPWSLLARLGLGSDFPPLLKSTPRWHNGTQVGSGFSQPPLQSPQKSRPVWPQGGRGA